MKSITIAVYNLKGGVGKTTLTWAAAAILTSRGLRVLCVDLDSQCNLTYSFLGRTDDRDNVLACMLNRGGVAATKTAEYGGIIPGSPMIDGLPDLATDTVKRPRLLADALKCFRGLYDLILLDCPPGINLININALLAADYVITPTHLDTYSLQGISRIADVLKRIKDNENQRLIWAGIAVTDWRPRLLLTKHLAEQLKAAAAGYQTRLYASAIKHSTRINELILNRLPLSAAAGDSYVAYSCLVDNILSSVGRG